MEDRSKLGRVGERPFWIRTSSVFLRAAHLLAASAVLGACLWSIEDGSLRAWWIATGISGVLLLAAECIRHVELYREFGGWCTILKLVLVAAIPLAASAAGPWLMSAAFVIAVLGAHFPRRWRHRKLF